MLKSSAAKKLKSGECVLLRWEGAYVRDSAEFKLLGRDGSPEREPYESVGWVGYVGPDVMTLLPHVGLDDDGKINRGMGETVIPYSAIHAIERV